MAAATAAFLMGVCGMLQAAPVAEVISYDQSGLKASDARIRSNQAGRADAQVGHRFG